MRGIRFLSFFASHLIQIKIGVRNMKFLSGKLSLPAYWWIVTKYDLKKLFCPKIDFK